MADPFTPTVEPGHDLFQPHEYQMVWGVRVRVQADRGSAPASVQLAVGSQREQKEGWHHPMVQALV